jgi:hypothetical protein
VMGPRCASLRWCMRRFSRSQTTKSPGPIGFFSCQKLWGHIHIYIYLIWFKISNFQKIHENTVYPIDSYSISFKYCGWNMWIYDLYLCIYIYIIYTHIWWIYGWKYEYDNYDIYDGIWQYNSNTCHRFLGKLGMVWSVQQDFGLQVDLAR